MNQPLALETLLPAKLSVPPLPPAHCVRPRLCESLTMASRAQVTAVLGPAGSGKTTLVAGWARSGAAGGPVAWVTLDERDDSPGVFWSYVLHALRDAVPELGAGTPAPTTPAPTTPAPTTPAPTTPAPILPGGVDRATLSGLATSLAARVGPVVLVLDRAETITDRSIAADLDLLIRYSAPGLRLVVVGRSARLVPVQRYRLAGELTEIGPDQLALTLAETAELLRTHGVRLADGDVAALHRHCGGWMTGVCLGALAGPPAVAQFLRTEVFEVQPARMRDLLLRTSILDEVDPSLADRLTGRSDARGVLDELVRANAFVEPLDGSRFRCQPLFRAVLVDDLYARHPQLVRRLHGSAARWYAEQRRFREALRHAVTIGDWDYAATLAMTRLGVAWLLTAPEAGPVCTLLADVPDEQGGTAAALLRSVLALARFDPVTARCAIDEAEKSAAADLDEHALHEGIGTVRVLLGRLTGDVDLAESAAADLVAAADDLAGRPRPEEPVDPARSRTLVLANLGAAQLWAGRYDAARATLGRAVTATEPGSEYGVHDALAQLALLEVYEGRLHRADRYARESLAVAERAGLPPGTRVGAADVALAAIALARHDPPAVREHLHRAVTTPRSRHDPLTAIATALLRARIAQGRQDGRRALAATQAARANGARWPLPTDVKDFVEATALSAHLLLGATGPARACLGAMSDGPVRTLALGQLHLAEGRPDEARSVLSTLSRRTAPPVIALYAALTLGRIATAHGDLAAGRRALREALDLGQPEQLRRPFVESGAWIRQVLRQYPDLAAQHGWLSSQDRSSAPTDVSAPIVEPLTAREVDVLRRLSEALSTEDIAAALYLSVNTVKTHLKSIYRKLGTSGRSATARRARELHLLEPPAPDSH